MHHSLVLNEYVFKRRRRNTNLCTFCDVHPATLVHFFWDCISVRQYWKDLLVMMKDICYIDGLELELTAQKVIFNNVDKSGGNIVNFIILVAKLNLYCTRCRNDKPNNSKSIFSELLFIRNIEKYYATLNNSIDKHNKKWHNIHSVPHNSNSPISNYRLFRRPPSALKITPLTQC